METKKEKIGCFSIILTGAALGLLDGIMIVRGVDISRNIINITIFLIVFFKALLTFRTGVLLFQQETHDERFQKGLDSIIIRMVSGFILMALNFFLVYAIYFFVSIFILIGSIPR